MCKIDIDRVLEALSEDSDIGFCKACGAETDGVEPDARNYECEACGARHVFGAQELLIELG
jgi:DNA-directed RNA polymerase subunit RPC12/RpoP